MKKALICGILSLVLLTGCGKAEKIECTNSQKTAGTEMNTVLNVEIKGNDFVSLNMEIDMILPENLLSQKTILVQQLEKQYAGFEKQYGAQPITKETDKGAKVTFEMTKEQAKKFYGNSSTKVTKKEVIATFEKQGFSCK